MKKIYSKHKSICPVCNKVNTGTSTKKVKMCDECYRTHHMAQMQEKRIAERFTRKLYCKCCGKRIYGNYMKGMCEFCNTEYIGMMQEKEYREMSKEDVFKAVRKVYKTLDDMEITGTNLQGVAI